jgi:serine/threonine protein kinase
MVTNGTSDTKSVAPPSLAVIYQKLACTLLDTINEAVQSTTDRRLRSSFKMVRKTGTENDSNDFADLYDMNEKEILGMGRFGMVFGGTMRRNGVRVAIKKILTAQCSAKDRENIEQEATYLFQLNHPGLLDFFFLGNIFFDLFLFCTGILKFERIFDFEQHIFLVTERLDTDMLNFILSNTKPKARLNEDVTRFLAFQLVAAIRYLHFKNIA